MLAGILIAFGIDAAWQERGDRSRRNLLDTADEVLAALEAL